MTFESETDLTQDYDLIEWYATTGRLLKIAIMGEDAENIEDVYERIAKKFGDSFARLAFVQMIDYLMRTQDWSFFDEEGNPSPLL